MDKSLLSLLFNFHIALQNIPPAIIGLLGVLLGGLITVISNYLLAVRQDRAARKKQEHNNLVEALKAARIIEAELMYGYATGIAMIDSATWYETHPLTSDEWRKYLDTLSTQLSYNNWMTVIRAVQAVIGLSQIYQKLETYNISPEKCKALEESLIDVPKAFNILKHLGESISLKSKIKLQEFSENTE